MIEWLGGHEGARRKIYEELQPRMPHRAIVRELILEQDDILNPFVRTVRAILSIDPNLASWAADPVSTPLH